VGWYEYKFTYTVYFVLNIIEISFNDIWRVHIYVSRSIAQEILVLGLQGS